MTQRTAKVRVWGAVMTADGPVCEVRDLPVGATVGEMLDPDPSFRGWRLDVIEAHGTPRQGHSRGPACIPGRPCAKCQAQAQSWWWEHGRRTKARNFAATRVTDLLALRHGDKAEDRGTYSEALADAQARGWPYVVETDGHGRWLNCTRIR